MVAFEEAVKSWTTYHECGCITEGLSGAKLLCDEHTCYKQGCCSACRQPKMLLCSREKGHDGACNFFLEEGRVSDVGDKERIYPCQRCGKLRSKAEGGTCFTVCDECWDECFHGSKAVEKLIVATWEEDDVV